MSQYQLILGDCLEIMPKLPPVDMIFCSPPYEDVRAYGSVNFRLRGQEWVDWAAERFRACWRLCPGLTAWVVEGRTRGFRYSMTPILMMADLHRAGVTLRKPPLYRRDGVPGSGGPDWLKNHYEFVVSATHGRLPWSDNTAAGHKPRWPAGGGARPRSRDGSRQVNHYKPPDIANPGNIIDCGAAGGGRIGSRLAHENEAPFPEQLVKPFILSFCRPGGTVLDCFCGSGTTGAVALRYGRKFIGIDVRQDQLDLSERRIRASSLPLLESLAPIGAAATAFPPFRTLMGPAKTTAGGRL